MRAIIAMVVLLSLASAADAYQSLREEAIALEKAGKGPQAVRIYERAARSGNGKAARRLSEIYAQGIPGVRRDLAESEKWAKAARILGDHEPVGSPPSAAPSPVCRPPTEAAALGERPGAKSPGDLGGAIPRKFKFRMMFFPGGGFRGVECHHDGLIFESRAGLRLEESITVRPSIEQWQAFRESLDRLNVWDWKPEYRDPDVRDGVGWSLDIEYTDRHIRAGGHNKYSETFDPFVDAVDVLLGHDKFR